MKSSEFEPRSTSRPINNSCLIIIINSNKSIIWHSKGINMYQVLSALHNIHPVFTFATVCYHLHPRFTHTHEKTEVERLNVFVQCHLAGKLVQWDQSQGSLTSAPALTLATTVHLSQAMRYFSWATSREEMSPKRRKGNPTLR